jgi:hypothetical protein
MHIIQLDRFVGQQGPTNFAVSFSGTLAQCRAQTHHDGQTFPLPKAGRDVVGSEPTSLIGPEGNSDPGLIISLQP